MLLTFLYAFCCFRLTLQVRGAPARRQLRNEAWGVAEKCLTRQCQSNAPNLMIYMDVFILYEYHENIGYWVWWWSGGVLMSSLVPDCTNSKRQVTAQFYDLRARARQLFMVYPCRVISSQVQTCILGKLVMSTVRITDRFGMIIDAIIDTYVERSRSSILSFPKFLI
jgi:hypothetical protein